MVKLTPISMALRRATAIAGGLAGILAIIFGLIHLAGFCCLLAPASVVVLGLAWLALLCLACLFGAAAQSAESWPALTLPPVRMVGLFTSLITYLSAPSSPPPRLAL